MGKNSFFGLLITVVFYANVFKFNEVCNHVRNVFIFSLPASLHSLNLFLLRFHNSDGLFQKQLKNFNTVFVIFHRRALLFFFNFETFSVFHEELHRSLLWQGVECFINFPLTTSEYFKLFRLLYMLVFCYVFHKSL
jgi:hypothetical protein